MGLSQTIAPTTTASTQDKTILVQYYASSNCVMYYVPSGRKFIVYLWGHSSIEQGVMFYRKSKAKKLLISHHAPERNDKELDIMSKSVLPKGVFFAKENKTIKLI